MFLVPLLNDSFIKNKDVLLSSLIDDNYCLIYLYKQLIICSYIRYTSEKKSKICRVNFIAVSSDLLFNLISKHNALIHNMSFSHSLYIAKEIYKAELSNIFLQSYIQS